MVSAAPAPRQRRLRRRSLSARDAQAGVGNEERRRCSILEDIRAIGSRVPTVAPPGVCSGRRNAIDRGQQSHRLCNSTGTTTASRDRGDRHLHLGGCTCQDPCWASTTWVGLGSSVPGAVWRFRENPRADVAASRMTFVIVARFGRFAEEWESVHQTREPRRTSPTWLARSGFDHHIQDADATITCVDFESVEELFPKFGERLGVSFGKECRLGDPASRARPGSKPKRKARQPKSST